MQVLFIQGAGAGVHDRWDDKLVASLERELGTSVRYPVMPGEADPKYAAWKHAIVRELGDLEDGAIVIGHSTGGTTLIHALAESPPTIRLGAIVLIAAPFIGQGGWQSEDISPRSDLSHRDVPIFLYHGTEDETVPFSHLALYAKVLPRASISAVPGGDHQLHGDLSLVARDLRAITPS